MALSQATLKQELLKLFDQDNPAFVGFPVTVADAATNFGNAYQTYAATAQDASGDLVVTTNLPLFISTLAGALPPDPAAGTPSVAAQAFGAAFTAYWTGGIFAIGIPPPTGIGGNGIFSVELTSLVTVVNSAALSTPLEVIFTVPPTEAQTADAQADSIATAFHTATTTGVTVLITGLDTTPPPPAGAGPLPIINTGFIS